MKSQEECRRDHRILMCAFKAAYNCQRENGIRGKDVCECRQPKNQCTTSCRLDHPHAHSRRGKVQNANETRVQHCLKSIVACFQQSHLYSQRYDCIA